MGNIPVGVTGIYEIPEYSDNAWLSWFGIKKEYRKLEYGKPKIFSISLCSEKVELWNNKFINISEENMLKNVKSIFILVFS